MNSRLVAVLCLIGAFLLNQGGSDGLIPIGPPSPVPGSGLHVLIVEDRGHRQDLPPTQFDAMMSADVDELIRKNNGHKYLYDQNQDVSNKDDPWVKDAMKVKRDSLPWLVIDNNGKGKSVPFPKDPREFKELVESYLK